MDAYDTKKLTKNFKYEGNINELIEYAEKYRENIDSAVLTEEDIMKIEKVKEKYITKNV